MEGEQQTESGLHQQLNARTKTSTHHIPSFPSCKLLACSLPKPRWSRKETAHRAARGRRCLQWKCRNRNFS